MKKYEKNQEITFTLKKTVSTNHKIGTYKTGKKWSKWSQVFRGHDGVLYQYFGDALFVSQDCIVTGTYAGESPFQFKGEKVLQVKNAVVLPPEPKEDEDEVIRQAIADNVDLTRNDNPNWWIDEIVDITEDDVMFKTMVAEPLSPSGLTADQEESAWAEFYGLYDETFTHPNSK